MRMQLAVGAKGRAGSAAMLLRKGAERAEGKEKNGGRGRGGDERNQTQMGRGPGMRLHGNRSGSGAGRRQQSSVPEEIKEEW
jgi:hypothetical protein